MKIMLSLIVAILAIVGLAYLVGKYFDV